MNSLTTQTAQKIAIESVSSHVVLLVEKGVSRGVVDATSSALDELGMSYHEIPHNGDVESVVGRLLEVDTPYVHYIGTDYKLLLHCQYLQLDILWDLQGLNKRKIQKPFELSPEKCADLAKALGVVSTVIGIQDETVDWLEEHTSVSLQAEADITQAYAFLKKPGTYWYWSRIGKYAANHAHDSEGF